MRFVQGDFVADTELFPGVADARHRGKMRVTMVCCKVVRRQNVLRFGTPDPLVGPMKAYLADAPRLQQLGCDNGHLIGLSIGGPDISHNIAPMFGRFNEVDYRRLERQIFQDTDIVMMRVKVLYADNDVSMLAVPEHFVVDVQRTSEADDDGPGDWRHYQTLRMAVPCPSPYPLDAEVAAAIAAVLPGAKPAVEPYAFLDALGIPGARAETAEFSELQKKYILSANAMYSLQAHGDGGMLRSDDPEDPIQTLCWDGGDNRPQVDHVIPQSKGGSNMFRNAMVLSRRFNGQKSAKLEAEIMAILLAARDERPRRTAANKARSSGHLSKYRDRPY